MKKFIASLFSNRFGIVLATANACYFASKVNHLMKDPLDAFFFSANGPAALSAILSVKFIEVFSHELSFSARRALANIFFAAFIVFQWLFIAWIAKLLAAKIRRPKL